MAVNQQRQVAIVTGGSRGIGRGIALAVARDANCNVVINYASNAAAADEVKREIETSGKAKAITVKADVSSAEDRKRLVEEAINAFGRIDLLVNNAGVAPNVRADILEAGQE